ncbi:MAG: hypothetical protein HFJ75_07785 [Eggerthellaceae bacterium]|nr:hypothetical protein [Eggerthellaceae bacterium]
MAEDGSITFSTALDNEQLERELKRAEREVKELEDKVSKWNGNKSAIEQQMESAERAIEATKAEIASLTAKMEAVPENIGDPDAYLRSQQQVKKYEAMIADANGHLEGQVADIDKLNNKWQEADGKVSQYGGQLNTAKARQKELGTEYAASMGRAGAATGKGLAAMGAKWDAFAAKVQAHIKKLFVFSLVLGALSKMKDYLSEAVKESDQFSASFANLKATLAGFAAPIVSLVTSVLTGLINVVTSMLMSLARLIDMVFRTDIAGSIKAAKDAAKAAEREAKAKKKTAKAAKEATKQIMAFDEINAMAADRSADTDTGIGDGGGALDWDALGAGKIDEALAQIMLILGAALLAVGAILAFSGINIPLGITLMAIGALMIYTAASEQWDNLPAEVQQAITAVMLVVGSALLVLGCILAFAVPGAQALGIGMMAAGAALLWSAVGINWDSMDAEMKGVVSGLMGLLSAALLVVGAILCFSGGGTPLGIGLIALGAAGLAADAAINWDSMPDEIKNVVSVLFGVLSVAFLVIGAVLAFSGPAMAPVGVGLMLIGAGLLVANAALNWDRMPQEVRNTVSTIMTIVSGALIVIGIVLICTGVGIPLGIACILAGIGSFVAAVALNTDWFLGIVQDIWAGVTSFWNSYIAPIFTYQWWADKFKCIANGLIRAVNNGLNAFGGFINNVTSGLSGLLRGFGIEWSWSVRMPQLPYLAQGAVIPPNRKFAAVLGDQKSGYNLEAPEGLIRQIVREEAGMGGQDMVNAVQQGMALALMQMLPILKEDQGGDVVLSLNIDGVQLAVASEKGRATAVRRGMLKPEIVF